MVFSLDAEYESRLTNCMIVSFGYPATEDLASGVRVERFVNIEAVACRESGGPAVADRFLA